MKYNRYTIKTTSEAEDIISATLAENGIDGVEIEDSVPWTAEDRKSMFVDELVLPDIPQGTAFVSFYLDAGSDTRTILGKVMAALDELRQYADIGDGTIQTSVTEDKDWLNSWKAFFHAFTIEFNDGRKVRLVPSWESYDAMENEMVIHIDPGTAFGTGAHETTKLCIKELEAAVRPGMRMLDIGTGSGILAMMALKFGASGAVGTDLDPNAVPAVKDNFEKNGLKNADFRLIIGDVTADEDVCRSVGGGYDICTANILPDVLVRIIPIAYRFLVPGGIFILSGILEEKADMITDCLDSHGYGVDAVNQMGEWVSVTAHDRRSR